MIINDHQKQMIESLPLGIATANKDGMANLIVVLYAKVVSDDVILITDNYMKQTVKNLKRDERICLGVWTKNEGWKFIGRAKYQTTGKWLKCVKEMKENAGEPAKGAIIVKVEKIIKLG